MLPLAGLVLGLGLLAAAVPSAEAAKVYQWKDSAGITHVTDNPDLVPPEYRDDGGREVKPLGSIGEAANLPGSGGEGEVVWRNKCVSCHHLGEGVKDEKVGLANVIIDSETRFRRTPEQLAEVIRYAADGRYSDMPKVDVSDDEVKTLADYLLSR